MIVDLELHLNRTSFAALFAKKKQHCNTESNSPSLSQKCIQGTISGRTKKPIYTE